MEILKMRMFMSELLPNTLDENSDWNIELWPKTPEGTPDILIEDLLALEFKFNPNKAERDRCVGQCAGYSRLWPTWIILVDTPDSRVGRLEELLQDKGLEHLAVWNFPLNEYEEDDDGGCQMDCVSGNNQLPSSERSTDYADYTGTPGRTLERLQVA
jgi:hypothetical protein